jgi:hypothetical protein
VNSGDSLCEFDPLLWLHELPFDLFKSTDRQRRLCGCYLIRKMIWNLIPDPKLRDLVATSELFADGRIPRREFFAQARAARKPHKALYDTCWSLGSKATAEQRQAYHAFATINVIAAPSVSPTSLRALGSQTGATIRCSMEVPSQIVKDRAKVSSSVQKQFRTLPLEFFGQPSALPIPAQWSTTVDLLARALYEGDDCHFALHDALSEEGYEPLAEHFVAREHPKGCWALDLILGSQIQQDVLRQGPWRS